MLQAERRRSGRYHPEKVDIYLYELPVGTRHEIVNKAIGKNRYPQLKYGRYFRRYPKVRHAKKDYSTTAFT